MSPRRTPSRSLRHRVRRGLGEDGTFATLLSKAGVVPRMAQELMRHSPSTSLRAVSPSNGDIRLTMNVYTYLHVADTASAVAALPAV